LVIALRVLAAPPKNTTSACLDSPTSLGRALGLHAGTRKRSHQRKPPLHLLLSPSGRGFCCLDAGCHSQARSGGCLRPAAIKMRTNGWRACGAPPSGRAAGSAVTSRLPELDATWSAAAASAAGAAQRGAAAAVTRAVLPRSSVLLLCARRSPAKPGFGAWALQRPRFGPIWSRATWCCAPAALNWLRRHRRVSAARASASEQADYVLGGALPLAARSTAAPPAICAATCLDTSFNSPRTCSCGISANRSEGSARGRGSGDQSSAAVQAAGILLEQADKVAEDGRWPLLLSRRGRCTSNRLCRACVLVLCQR
jgi:hypothetical protein